MKFNIYATGFMTNGERAGAQKLGTGEGETFKEACDDLARRNPEFRQYYRPETLSHWGCGLYPTIEEARAAFPDPTDR